MIYTDFLDADQGSFSQQVDDPAKPPPPPCLSADGEEYEYRIDEQAAYPSIPDRDIIAARHSGLKMCAAMRREFLARARHADRPKIVVRKPARARKSARARARRSHASHGGARKAADGSGSSNGGSEPPPCARLVERRSPDKLIDEFRRSTRGDLRVLAALATIAAETQSTVKLAERSVIRRSLKSVEASS